MYATIDLESVANDRAEQSPSFLKPRPAANLKDPVKIEASIAEKRQKMKDEFALHWTTAQIVCLSLVTDCDAPLCWYGEDEIAILTAFGDYLKGRDHIRLCGKSTANFDLPMLTGRFMVHDLGVPDQLRNQDISRVRDVDHIFGFSSACQQHASLNQYAFGLGIQGKLATGLAVQDWYNQAVLGDATAWNSMSQYCIQDAMIAHEILRRWKKPFAGTMAPPTIQDTPF